MKHRIVLIALALILTEILPAVPGNSGDPFLPAGGASAGPRQGGLHEGQLVLSDYHGMALENVTIRPDGGVQLERDNKLDLRSAALLINGNQTEPAIAQNSKGEYLVVFTDQTSGDIYGQRLSPSGGLIDPAKLLVTGSDIQIFPAVAFNSRDELILTWRSMASLYSTTDLYLQRFDSALAKLGSEVRLAADAGTREPASIGVDAAGGFVVVWSADPQSDYDYNVYAQRFNPDGTLKGMPIAVDDTTEWELLPDIAVFPGGEFLVFWQKSVDFNFQIAARAYDADGKPKGAPVLVAQTVNSQHFPSVDMDSSGGLVVAWRELAIKSSIKFRKLDQNATPKGNMLSVGPGMPYQDYPEVMIERSGDFLITWNERPTASFNDMTLCAQEFWNDGTPKGSPMKIDSYMGSQPEHAAAVDRNDDFQLVWSELFGGTGYDLKLARLVHSAYPPEGALTGSLTPPEMALWTRLAPEFALQNSSGNSLSFQFSPDGGASWVPVPPNGSLVAAGGLLPLKLRAKLLTQDRSSTPVLYNLTLDFVSNVRPWVDLGADLQVWRNSKVKLDAGPSDGDGDPLTFNWSQIRGPRVPLGGPDNSTFELTLRSSGTYEFSVTANDGLQDSFPSFLNVTVTNRPPVVSAGPALLLWKCETVFLRAFASDPDGDALCCTWTQASGAYLYFEEMTGASIEFNATAAGEYRFEVVANDSEADSEPASINVTIWSKPPLATLKVLPLDAFAGQEIAFNASESYDSDGMLVSFLFRYGDGNESGWVNNSVTRHAFQLPGQYLANVTVRDEDGNLSTSEPVRVTVRERPLPRITLLSPREGEVLTAREAEVTFRVENHTLGQQGHIHFQLDGKKEEDWRSPAPFALSNLTDGRHVLRAWLEDESHSRLPNPEAECAVNFTVAAKLAELEVIGMSCQPETPVAGQMVIIKAVLRNNGSKAAGDFNVSFYIDGTAQPPTAVRLAAVGASQEFELTWNAVAGKHTVSFVADPDNLVEERNKLDNRASLVLEVGKGPEEAQRSFELPIILGVLIAVVATAAAAVLLRGKKTKGK